MANKILKISPFRLLKFYSLVWLFLLVFILGGYAVFNLIAQLEFNWLLFAILFALITTVMAIYSIIAIKGTYYEVNKNGIIQHSGKKSLQYNFNDIKFIDEQSSLKHKTLIAVSKDEKEINLLFDKEAEIFKLAKKFLEKQK